LQLTADEIDLLRESFRNLARQPALASGMFYDRLFVIAPGFRQLFPADLEEQGIKLMNMLGLVVAQMHEHDALVPLVSDLARRHVDYGARPEDYTVVGSALLWTLERGLGDQYTQAVRAAWEKAYAALCQVMVSAVARG